MADTGAIQMTSFLQRLDIITETNKKTLERHIELKERLVSRNAEKSTLYLQKKNGKHEKNV